MSSSGDALAASCSVRTRHMVNTARSCSEKNDDQLPQEIYYLDRLKTFASIHFSLENHKSMCDLFESSVDDSDLDKDYNPTSSDSEYDDNIVEQKRKKRKNNTVQSGSPNEERERQNTGALKITRKRLVGMEKIDRDKTKHPIWAICEGKCRRQCKYLTEDHRHSIWNQYWNMEYTRRRKWLSKHLKLIPVKRKSMSAQHSRSESRYFTLPLSDFTKIAVCILKFLNTLRYTNDSVITELVAAIKNRPLQRSDHMAMSSCACATTCQELELVVIYHATDSDTCL
ncbi:unnamed protein product [Psylliodes chrysocephalus]|uniref:Uncharacterized protein n=1 Tax=Psylliodes chrysocephalus TaxID=3402493 RepID=A0A9P0CDA2_9CUCU|nr:unnamed protein product [Psylliodes chrysocephala]